MATKSPTPSEFAQEICSVQPMDSSLIKALIDATKSPELLPKHWEPSKEYTEISRGIGIDYEERIVESHEAQTYVISGWDINNTSQKYLWMKWQNAIIAMERT